MKINFPNRILLTNLAICLFLAACSSAPATTPQVSSPIPAVNASTVELGLLTTSKDLLAKRSKEAPLQNYKRACAEPKMR